MNKEPGEMSEETVPKRVVGLRYQPDEGLPEVILKGAGPLAEELLRRRTPRGPPVVKDEALLDALYRLPLDSAIGPELFQAVAALLAHIFAVEGKMRGEER
jgi:flagellar biosynthesis protein